MTRPLNLSERTPGHAMIAVSTAGAGEEAWGFYPNGVQDEVLKGGWHRYNTSSVIPISQAQYVALKNEIGVWKKKRYVIGVADCTDFALSVMSAAKIPIPSDSLWPGNLGEDMDALHGSSGGRCLDRRPPINEWKFVQ
jgi:hypothetical protein